MKRFSLVMYSMLVPLAVMGLVVGLMTKASLQSNASELIAAHQIKELAITSLALLLTQDDASKSMLFDPTNTASDARKIEAYDKNVVVLGRIATLSKSSEVGGIVSELKKMDDEELRPLDTSVLELLGDGKEEAAKRVYFTKYEPARARYEALLLRLGQLAETAADNAARDLEKKNQASLRNICVALGVGILIVLGAVRVQEVMRKARDELERKVQERTAQLAEAQERSRGIFVSSKDAIGYWSLEGKLVDVNESYSTLTGYSREELFALRYEEHMVHGYLERDSAMLQRMLETGEPADFESEFLRKDGTRLPVQLTAFEVLGADGQPRGLATIVKDITVRKRIEQQLIDAKEAAEAASRAKSEFLANMSHEIRTPMNGVMGMTELVLDTELTHEQREYLNTVKMSADSLLIVLNDILDFSKIEAGRLELDPICFNLRDNLEEIMRAMAFRAHEKGLELLCDVKPELPDFVVADATRIRQIITNLVGNAIKFTEHGEVALLAGLETRDRDLLRLHFSVRDTGIGIAPDKHKAIFEPFAQADGSTTRKYGGTGLGLSICTRLVEAMQGKIWVESEPGKGSSFHFSACCDAATGEEEHQSVKDANLAGLQVLVVDDNATNRRILVDMLWRWHMRPTPAGSASEALSLLQRASEHGLPFALVLTDVHMPGMDGFDLVEHIKASNLLADAVIMMLTSGEQRGDGARCRELGVAAYLTKPVRRAELRAAMAQALIGRKEEPDSLITLDSLRRPGAASTLRILLAEDNPVNQRVACRILEKDGHRVVIAGNGREAVKALARQEFDLVLMDVQMPEMDGFEATAAIRAGEKQSGLHIPIVAMTAHAMTGDRERCLAAGMDAYLSKPIHARDLLNLLENGLKEFTPVAN